VLLAAIAVPCVTFIITYTLFYTVQDEAQHRRDPKYVPPTCTRSLICGMM